MNIHSIHCLAAMALWGCHTLATAAPNEPLSRGPVFILEGSRPFPPVMLDGWEVKPGIALADLGMEAGRAQQGGVARKLVIDTLRAHYTTTLTAPTTVVERRPAGQQQTPNPDYVRARQSLKEAEEAYNKEEAGNREVQSQARQMASTTGVGAWGALLGSAVAVMGISSVNDAKARLEEARRDAAETRATLSETVYRDVRVPAATERAALSGEVVVYLIDPLSQKAKMVRVPVSGKLDTAKKMQGTVLVGAGPSAGAPVAMPVALDSADLEKRLAAAPDMPASAVLGQIRTGREAARREAEAADRQARSETEDTLRRLAQLGSPHGSSAVGGGMGAVTASGGAEDTDEESEEAEDAGGDGAVAAGESAPAGTCHRTMAFLADRFPPFTQSEPEKVRKTLLAFDLDGPMRAARASGDSPESMVQKVFAQAQEYDKSTTEALSTAASVDALGTTDEQFMRKLKDGSLALGDCEAIRSSALCMAAIYKMSAVFYRSVGAEMQCHIMNGSWPK